MVTKLLLWLTVILFSFHFAGHLFDIVANQPNWKSGEILDVSNYRDFYHYSSPKNYFFLPVVGGPLICLIALILVWKNRTKAKLFIGTSFLISVIVLVFTVIFFVPINEYIFSTSEYDASKLKDSVSKWISMEYIRFILIGLGMITSIMGLESYSKGQFITK